MDFIPKNNILEFKPDTLEYIRKQYDLDKPGQMKEAVNILHEWVQKQSHFIKKDFSDSFYEKSIMACKGSIERAKNQIDRLCTMRTLLPQFFVNCNVKNDYGHVHDFVHVLFMPKLTDEHYRIELLVFHNTTSFKSSDVMDFFKSTICLAEYMKYHDYMNGFISIVDFSKANLMDIMLKMNPMELRQAMSIYIEGYGMRIKSIHLITDSKIIDGLIVILKQVLSPKIASRIHCHSSIEDVYKYVPRSLLPKDYGGDERSSKELHEDWMEELTSEKHINYVREMNKACTDETYRQRDKFNEQCAGLPGTFRLLSVD